MSMQIIEQCEVLGKEFRVYGDFDNPLFLAKDVAEWIEHSNSRMMLQNIDEEEKICVNNPYAVKGQQEQWFLTEDGLYEVLMQSRKPIAKAFRKEVKHILKTLRKTGTYTVPKSPMQLLELEFQAIREIDNKVEDVKRDLEDFKDDMPLLALEIERITKARNRTAVRVLCGKESNAYKNKSIRSKVYSDMSKEIERQFGVNTYKAIKRKDCDKVIELIENYFPPMCLEDEILTENSQIAIKF